MADRYRYLDHAGIAAPPTVVAHAVARDASAATMLGSMGAERRAERAEEVRTDCAALLGVSPDHLTFSRSAADALQVVAYGIRWNAGDRVLLTDTEHPATAFPWTVLGGLGVTTQQVRSQGPAWALPPESVEAALIEGGGAIKVVVVPWVHYARGWRTDLAAVCDVAHAHGAMVVADVVQGVGVIPARLAAWGVDVAVADSHSWLLGPEGIALLYLSPGVSERLWAPRHGLAPLAPPPLGVRTEAQPSPPHRRFEAGSSNRLGIAGLGAAVSLLQGAGIDAIWSHVDRWCDGLVNGLTELGATVVSDRSAAGRSAIVTATFGDADPAELTDRLITYGVVVSGRSDAVRFAPHGWNDDDDLEATLHAVRRAWRR